MLTHDLHLIHLIFHHLNVEKSLKTLIAKKFGFLKNSEKNIKPKEVV